MKKLIPDSSKLIKHYSGSACHLMPREMSKVRTSNSIEAESSTDPFPSTSVSLLAFAKSGITHHRPVSTPHCESICPPITLPCFKRPKFFGSKHFTQMVLAWDSSRICLSVSPVKC